MKLKTRILTAILLVAGSTGVVYAVSKHGHWHMTPQEKVEFVTERVSKKLDLTSEQQQNFNALANQVAQIMGEARASKKQHIDEIAGLLQQPSFDQARALEMLQQQLQLVNEKAPLVVTSLAVFLDSLDSAQKQRLQDYISHHRDHHRHGDGH